MNKKLVVTGAVLGALAVIFGAFAAHGLKAKLSTEQLASFNTGVRYQMYHALFLLFISNLSQLSDTFKKRIFVCIVLGVILFSGSIYLLTTELVHGVDFSFIGMITPIGGILLIAGWLMLLFSMLKTNRV